VSARRAATLLLVGAALVAAAGARAQAPARIANIEKAAAEIAGIHHQKGNDGATAAIDACYKRELPNARALTPGLETCMAQDIIVAKISASFFARMPESARRTAGVSNPGDITKAMADRVYGILGRLKVPEKDAQEFSKIVQLNGMEAYGRARFPSEFPEKKS